MESKPRAIQISDRIRESARGILPFRLTEGQRSSLKEIVDDMQRPAPMNRLLAGRCRCGQDDCRAAGRTGRDGERVPGRLHGADRDPRGAALSQSAEAAREITVQGRADHRRDRGGAAPRSAGASGRRRYPSDRRHARAGAGHREFPRARAGHHRRTAPVRRRAARDAAIERADAGRARHDGHADSAHAGADGVRRSRCVRDPRHAAGTPGRCATHREAGIAAGRDIRARAGAARAGPSGLRRVSADRGIGEGRPAGRDRDGRPPGAGGLSRVSRRAPARPHEAGRQGSGDARLRDGRDPCARRRRRSSRSASTCRTRR